MLCREATSDQARPNRLNHKILDIGNRDIIGIAISFLSDTHFGNIYYLINQYPYQYLVFIVRFLQDSGYAPGAIIISTSPSASLKPDESRGVSFNIWILPSPPPVTMTWFFHYAAQSIRKEKGDGQAHLVVGEYWANDTSMTNFPEWMKDPISWEV